MNVGKHAAARNSHLIEKLVKLFIVANGELDVSWNDPRLFVISSGIARQLEHLCCQILHHCSHVDGSSRADALRILAFLHESRDASHWELESGFGRFGDHLRAFILATTSFAIFTLGFRMNYSLCFLKQLVNCNQRSITFKA